MVAKIPTLELNLGEERRGVQAKAAWDATPGRLGSAPHRQGCARPPVPETAPLATLRGEQVRHLMESIRLLANVSDLFVAKCLDGIAANRERAKALLEGSPVMATARRWCTNRRENWRIAPVSAVLSAQSATFSA